MYSPRGVAFGASYTDIHAQVPAYKGLIVAAMIGAAFSLLGIVMRNFRWIGYAAVGLVVMSFIAGYAYPEFVQQFTVSPNEIEMCIRDRNWDTRAFSASTVHRK